MKNIFLFGECMIELMSAEKGELANTMKQSFAGDVFNTAVYLKRIFTDVKVNLVTAVGKDQFSLDMIQYFENENIATEFVFKSEDKIPGLYSIQLDDEGERSFTYWRNDSAARKTMQHIDEDTVAELAKGDMFFFSGISLAVVEADARAKFWDLVTKLKSAGVQIVFDPNYRPRLWKNEAQAKEQFDKAFSQSDMLLPGIDDFNSLYGMDNFDQVNQFLAPYQIDEIIVKNGPETVISVVQGVTEQHHITPVQNVVDTTSAGDSFNGAYLGARLNGKSIIKAIDMASKAAGFVIQHKGAIVEKQSFTEFTQTHLI
ncbi:sugar kinase [Thalassomonas sp. M1454]|uniref:sugar kinase n=1 Tax=Thalassomonas sp. M1454 TaxID=2594477 RepID=UPI00117DE7A3|nr:sugar kinase [Thalassomonas sp. M1454]TRX54494.1 sugar kinase [Thalassomonas sp. M1454]